LRLRPILFRTALAIASTLGCSRHVDADLHCTP
jgi:hypothetical protein